MPGPRIPLTTSPSAGAQRLPSRRRYLLRHQTQQRRRFQPLLSWVTSSSLTIAINAIGATDNVGVAGYLVTESSAKPAATAPGWSTTARTGYTFASAGAKTLYAWAKDAANNVSTSRSAGVTITLAPTPPPSEPADEMGAWIGTWFSVTLRNEGLFVNGVGLTNDHSRRKGT